jgi:hypothetical protein
LPNIQFKSPYASCRRELTTAELRVVEVVDAACHIPVHPDAMHHQLLGAAMKIVRISIALLTLVPATRVHAMQIATSGDQLILSGPVVSGDTAKIADTLTQNTTINTVILRNSPGGDVATGYEVGEMFRRRSLRTAVSGYCYSSCSRMLLGGRKRIFTDDYPPDHTEIGFHGHYQTNGQIDSTAVRRFGLKDWIIKYSDGRADPELVERWVNIPESHDLIHFYHPTGLHGYPAATFFCHGNEPSIFECEAIRRTALDLGVITSLDTITANDLPKR